MSADHNQLGAGHVLDQAMGDRRVELGLEWTEVAERADVVPETLRQVRYGKGSRDPLRRWRVERALAWEKGSLDAIESGGSPTPDLEEEERIRLGEQVGVANTASEPNPDRIEIDRDVAERIADALLEAARALRGDNPGVPR